MSVPSFPALKVLMPIKRTPIWSTIKQPSISGQDVRLPLWSYPKWRYELQIEVLRSAAAFSEFQSLVGLYNSVNGPAGVFSYADPSDGIATAQPFGVGNGAITTFQLVRTLGGFTEPVFAPGAVSISAETVGGTAVVSPASYSIGPAGVVTFNAAPAAGTTLIWTGAFSWLCQFDEDEMQLSQDYASIWSTSGLKFTTVKL